LKGSYLYNYPYNNLTLNYTLKNKKYEINFRCFSYRMRTEGIMAICRLMLVGSC